MGDELSGREGERERTVVWVKGRHTCKLISLCDRFFACLQAPEALSCLFQDGQVCQRFNDCILPLLKFLVESGGWTYKCFCHGGSLKLATLPHKKLAAVGGEGIGVLSPIFQAST